MYIARATLSVGRHGRMERVVPGEVIADFATWPYANQLALLRSGHVEKVGAHYAANLSTDGGYLHFAPAPAQPEPRKIAQVAVQVQADARKTPVHSRLSDSIEAPFDLPHPCPHCAKSFGRERGLKRHLSSSHKGGR